MKTRQIAVIVATLASITMGESGTAGAQQSDFSRSHSARLQGERELLPEYAGAVHLDQVKSEEHASSMVAYASNDPPEKIVQSYVSFFTSQGWKIEKKPWVEVGHPAADNTRSSTLTATLVKDDLRVNVEAEKNTKDPDKGATNFSVSFTGR